jgi:hypothetical protein
MEMTEPKNNIERLELLEALLKAVSCFRPWMGPRMRDDEKITVHFSGREYMALNDAISRLQSPAVTITKEQFWEAYGFATDRIFADQSTKCIVNRMAERLGL